MDNAVKLETKKLLVNCVIVTYNRLELLKEALAALELQSYPIQKIIVVDNCSTDETPAFLAEKAKDNRYVIERLKENVGGSGGFSHGMKVAVLHHCDYIWLMDDDTIPSPAALERLVEATTLEPEIGFVCSRVNWTDGEPHVMNKAGGLIYSDKEKKNPARKCIGDVSGVYCSLCSFVSVLVNTQAVIRLGLPVKEFFIWCDDIEYTLRISDAGYPCFYVEKSVVCHKTASNYAPSIEKAPVSMAWRFYYQARNRCYIKRQKGGNKLLFYFSVWNMYRVYKHRISRRPKEERKEFLEAVRKGCRDGLTFYPPIEYVQ